MAGEADHRKTVEHWNVIGDAHALTWSCYLRRPLLSRDDFKDRLQSTIRTVCQERDFHISAYVIMPEHVHLLVRPPLNTYSISDLLYAIKRPISYQFKQTLISERNPLLESLMVSEGPSKTTFRFWQQGPGYDRNIRSIEGLHDEISYIHRNPVRRGLCPRPEDWRWSSAFRSKTV